MSGASRAQNSISESCANASSFFGRTSSPFREKIRAPRLSVFRTRPNAITHICPLDSAKDHKVKLPSKGIFIRKLCEITFREIKRSACIKRRGNMFFDSFMKYFARIISLRMWRGWQKVKFDYVFNVLFFICRLCTYIFIMDTNLFYISKNMQIKI